MARKGPGCDLTILTPSHNRAGLLPRLFQSILDNHVPGERYEWLVVDDGSTDGTETLVAGFAATAPFPIGCLHTPHGGKHRALNAGFDIVQGRWIAVIDSDDWLADGGIATLLQEIDKADAAHSEAIFLSLIVTGRAEQFSFAKPRRAVSYVDSLNSEKMFDCTRIFSARLCHHKFPEYEGEVFLSEGAYYIQWDETQKVYLSNEVAVIVQYQPGGLSANSLRLRVSNPMGNQRMYQAMSEAGLQFGLHLRSLLNFGRFWWHGLVRRARVVRPRSMSQCLGIIPGALIFVSDFFRR